MELKAEPACEARWPDPTTRSSAASHRHACKNPERWAPRIGGAQWLRASGSILLRHLVALCPWVLSLRAISPTVKMGQNTYVTGLLDAEMASHGH